MSTSEEEPSQLQRLLSESKSSPPSTDRTLSLKLDSLDGPQDEEAESLSKRSHQPQFQDFQTQTKPCGIIKALDCYQWLLHERRERKESESVSTDSTGSASSVSDASLPPLPVPKPPDGGWGWMVVLGSFLVLVICDGLSYCFGILYSELLVQFGDSRSKTSLVGSVFFGVSMILGPLASAMTTKFGCRNVTIFGGVLSSLGFVLSYFATSINMLCITFSVIVGIGFSFCFITSVVIVHFYFDKRRSLATGLAVCGTGVGTFSFAPLMELLIKEYGCRGFFLIMAGISLNLVVCGLLFRPLKFSAEERRRYFYAEFDKLPPGRENLELGRYRNISECTEFSTDVEVLDEESRTMSMLSLPTFACGNTAEESPEILIEALKNSRNPHLTFHRFMKNVYFRSDSQEEKEEGTETLGHSLQDTETYIHDTDSNPSSNTLEENMQYPKALLNLPKGATNTKQIPSEICLQTLSQTPEVSMPKRKQTLHVNGDLSHCTSFIDLSNEMRSRSVSKIFSGVHMGKHNAMGIQLLLYRTDIFYRHQLRQGSYNPCLLGTSCPELMESNPQPQIKWKGYCHSVRSFITRIIDILVGTTDLQLFRNVFFTAFVISNFMFYFWSDIPYMYAIDHALELDIESNKASFLISIIGIFNTIGQVIFGVIGDMKINLILVYAIVLAISGIFVGVVPLMEAYWMMAVAYSLFGFFVSVTFPFSTVLLVNFLGVDHLTSAYGLLMLMQGIANILGPPFAGWISDETKSYDEAFYLSGLFYALSGLIMFVIFIPGCRVAEATKADEEEKC